MKIINPPSIIAFLLFWLTEAEINPARNQRLADTKITRTEKKGSVAPNNAERVAPHV